MVKNKYVVQKIKIARKEQSILDDEEQLRSGDKIECQEG